MRSSLLGRCDECDAAAVGMAPTSDPRLFEGLDAFDPLLRLAGLYAVSCDSGPGGYKCNRSNSERIERAMMKSHKTGMLLSCTWFLSCKKHAQFLRQHRRKRFGLQRQHSHKSKMLFLASRSSSGFLYAKQFTLTNLSRTLSMGSRLIRFL